MNKYRRYLIELITPQNEDEMKTFPLFIDDYCYIKNNIENFTNQEIIEMINNYLSHYNLEIEIK
jgi:hypothetical protein